MSGSLDVLTSAVWDLVKKYPFALAIPGAIVALTVLWAAARRLYRTSPAGRRRELRKNLSRLACGVPIDYMDSLFGSAVSAQRDGDRIYRVYRAKEVYVYVTAPHKDDGVDAYAVTFRRRFFRFRILDLTSGQVDVKLPVVRFSEVPPVGRDGHRITIGARRVGYAESFGFGNPGGYLKYVLAYNQAGFGTFSTILPEDVEHSSGVLTGLPAPGFSYESPAMPELQGFRSLVTVNTLGVTSAGDLSLLGNWASIGVDLDVIRLIPE